MTKINFKKLKEEIIDLLVPCQENQLNQDLKVLCLKCQTKVELKVNLEEVILKNMILKKIKYL